MTLPDSCKGDHSFGSVSVSYTHLDVYKRQAANNSPKPTEEMWNAPVMMEFKHNTGLGESIGAITEDAPIGLSLIHI